MGCLFKQLPHAATDVQELESLNARAGEDPSTPGQI